MSYGIAVAAQDPRGRSAEQLSPLDEGAFRRWAAAQDHADVVEDGGAWIAPGVLAEVFVLRSADGRFKGVELAVGSGADDETFDESLAELETALAELADTLGAHVYDDEQTEPEPSELEPRFPRLRPPRGRFD